MAYVPGRSTQPNGAYSCRSCKERRHTCRGILARRVLTYDIYAVSHRCCPMRGRRHEIKRRGETERNANHHGSGPLRTAPPQKKESNTKRDQISAEHTQKRSNREKSLRY